MNLADVVTLTARDATALDPRKEEALNESRRDFKAISRLWAKVSWHMNTNKAGDLRTELETTYDNNRIDALLRTGSLPDADRTPGNWVTTLADTPTVRTEDLRRVADALGFAIFPAHYLRDPDGEAYGMRQAIHRFKTTVGAHLDVYVLGPVVHYDVQKHIAHTDAKLPLWGGKDIAQALMAIDMTVPAFRSMQQQVHELRGRMDNYDQRFRQIERDVQSLTTRMDDMQKQVESMKAEQVRNEVKASLLSKIDQFIAYDPLMFALPRGKRVTDDVLGFVGPFWGPDFKDIVLTALGFRLVEGQRVLLSKQARDPWTK